MAKLMFVLGTRPEAVKMAPVINAAKKDPRFKVVVCSTGQHREMIRPIFELFEIIPDYDFELMKPGQTLHDITSAILEKMRSCIQIESPDWVLVQGDTTSVMAASLCAFYDKIAVAHIEAGLRTGDILSPFPEEFNRRVTTLVARLHFAPTEQSAENLYREYVSNRAVEVTGNTGIDALLKVNQLLVSDSVIQNRFAEQFSFLNPEKKLILATVHRRESFGAPLQSIMKGLIKLAERGDVEIIAPLHLNPEVRKSAEAVLGKHASWVTPTSKRGEYPIWLVEPQDYLSFVYLMNRCHFIISDSGGVQEEAPSLGKPVLVVRETTERPEAVQAGTSKLIGPSEEAVIREGELLLDNSEEFHKMARAHNPYGDGQASERILNRLAHTSPILGAEL